MLKQAEHKFEAMLFASRWLLAPFYFGLVIGIGVLFIKFAKELIHLLSTVLHNEGSETIVDVLTLVDVTLVANLLLIIIFVGYETFVSKIDTKDHEDRPDWMGRVSFSGLKIKLFGSIVAISGIELLNASMNIAHFTNEQIAWKSIVHVIFVVSGLLLAIMDRLAHDSHKDGPDKEH